MAKKCEICYDQERRVEIEAALLDNGPGNSMIEIAKRYKLGASTIINHKNNHIATIVDEVKAVLDKEAAESGTNRVLTSIEAYDLVIAQLPNVLDRITPADCLKALKQKHELLGDVKEEHKVTLDWLNDAEEVPK